MHSAGGTDRDTDPLFAALNHAAASEHEIIHRVAGRIEGSRVRANRNAGRSLAWKAGIRPSGKQQHSGWIEGDTPHGAVVHAGIGRVNQRGRATIEFRHKANSGQRDRALTIQGRRWDGRPQESARSCWQVS